MRKYIHTYIHTYIHASINMTSREVFAQLLAPRDYAQYCFEDSDEIVARRKHVMLCASTFYPSMSQSSMQFGSGKKANKVSTRLIDGMSSQEVLSESMRHPVPSYRTLQHVVNLVSCDIHRLTLRLRPAGALPPPLLGSGPQSAIPEAGFSPLRPLLQPGLGLWDLWPCRDRG